MAGRPRDVDRHFLTPLTGAPRRQKFATWDLESKDGPTSRAGFTRVFMAGFYDGKNYSPFFDQSAFPDVPWKYRAFLPGGCVDRFMRHVLTDRYRGYSFYAHNGGAFDFLHILPWLVRHKVEMDLQVSLVPLGNSGLLAIDVWKTKAKFQRWRFVDSVRLLPMSLAVACKSFGVAGKLTGEGSELYTRDGALFTIDAPEDDPGWIPYNQRDCVALHEVLERVHDLVELHFGGEIGLTAPSTAIKTLRRSYLEKPIARDVDTHEFIRRGYFGGRTEVICEEGHYLYDFDINSSYPFQMTLNMPAGGARQWEGEPPDHWKASLVGFCEVTVKVPDDIALPPLPIRAEAIDFPKGSGVEGKLLFPTGILEGIWEWGELENAIECGCQVLEWKNSVWYDAEPILRQFVETLYKYRNQAKCFDCSGALGKDFYCPACDKPGYDAGLDAFAKLISNATYGKFAQNPKRYKFYWVTDPDMPRGCSPIVEDDPDCQVWIKEEEGDAPFIMPQVSARITAQARVLLHRFCMEAQRRILRQCRRCHSKVTYSGRRDPNGWVFGKCHGGSGPHGDPAEKERINTTSVSCPCGGALETRHGRVYYMDTDSIMTDVIMPSGAELGMLKDEIPRYSGYLTGRFYGPKLYRLSVEPSYLELEHAVRRRMLERDVKFVGEFKDEAADIERFYQKGAEWERVKAKGIGSKSRTKENLEMLYDGALQRLAWVADDANRHPDGRLKQMPKEIAEAGTLVEQRLEKLGTLARLVKRDRKGAPIKKLGDDGRLHSVSAAFERGPLLRAVPKRLHLEGAKRIHRGDGTTRPYRIDMRATRAKARAEAAERAATDRTAAE